MIYNDTVIVGPEKRSKTVESHNESELITPAFADYNTKESSEASDTLARKKLRDTYLKRQVSACFVSIIIIIT